MAENPLEKDLKELKEKLQEKDETINNYLDRIELLEDNILKLESLIDEAESKGSFDSEKVQETKLSIELADREKKNRELKDKMGFLRKENISFRKKIEELEKENEKEASKSTIDLKKDMPSMDALIKELQNKINKQKQLINQLQQEGGAYASSTKYEAQLKEKDKKIEGLEAQIESKNKMEPSSNVITKSLTEELQMKLNRTRQQVKTLQETLNKYKAAEVPVKESTENKELNELKTENADLKEQIEEKNNQIQNLIEKISTLDAKLSEVPPKPVERILPAPGITELTKELQDKLNKRKQIINKLQTEIKRLKETVSTKTTQDDSIAQLKEELQSKSEKMKQLKSQIDEREKIIKEADISKLDSLRLNELKRMIKELEKLTNQQRTEIYELKK